MKKSFIIGLVLCGMMLQYFPVLANSQIETSIQTILCSEDAGVKSGTVSGKNFGGDTGLYIRSDDNGNPSQKSYLKFDISAINIRNLKSVKIELCMSDNNNYGTNGIGYVADNNWSGGTGDSKGATVTNGEICFDNAPELTEPLGILPRAPARYENIQFDVTDIIRRKYADSRQITFMLYPTQAVKYPSGYYSMEYEEDSKRPKLIVESYAYERVLTEIDMSGNGFIEKNMYFSGECDIHYLCRDQFGEPLFHEDVELCLAEQYSGVTLGADGHIDVAEEVKLPYITVQAKGDGVTAERKIYLLDVTDARNVVFDDEEETAKHGTFFNESIVDGGGIRLNPNGYIEFDVSVNPDVSNYITVKLDGSDTGNGMLFLTTSDDAITGAYGTQWPELDRILSEQTFTEGFAYTTYMLPESVTQGKEKIRAKIFSTGQATPYNSTPIAAQTEPSRKIFSAFSHTTAFSPEVNSVAQREPISDPVKGSDGEKEHLIKAVNNGIKKMLSWQAYGEKMDTLIASYPELSIFKGMLTYNGANYKCTDKEAWKTTNYPRTLTSNMSTMNTLFLFAVAYENSWSPYYHNPEMIDRILCAMDVLCVIQGANGGFQSARANWIGGPERKNANGSALEGAGQRGFSKAFCMIYDAASKEGLLDKEIDHDDNPETPKLTRREAYLDMFVKARYHMAVTGCGHAPNQDAHDKLAMVYHNQAVGLLDSKQAWDDDEIMKYVRMALGTEPNLLNKRYWVSPKGIPLEPGGTNYGGYDVGYSVATAELAAEIASVMKNQEAKEAANRMIDALSYFFYEKNDQDHTPIITNDAVVSWRNNFNPPRDSNYFLVPESVLYLDNPIATKFLQKYLEHGRIYQLDTTTTNAHLVDQIITATELLLNYDEIVAQDISQALLPYEKDSFIFADEVSGAIAFKNGDEVIYATVDYRNANENDFSLTRLHYMTDTNDIVANVEQKTPYGFKKLSIVEYKDYIIIMNSDEEKSYVFTDPSYTANAVDLRNSEVLRLEQIEIPPLTTRIFQRIEEKKVVVQNLSLAEGKLNFTLCNPLPQYQQGIIYVAGYDGKRLTKAYPIKCNLRDMSKNDFSVPVSGDNNTKYQVYFFDENLTPLSDGGELNDTK